MLSTGLIEEKIIYNLQQHNQIHLFAREPRSISTNTGVDVLSIFSHILKTFTKHKNQLTYLLKYMLLVRLVEALGTCMIFPWCTVSLLFISSLILHLISFREEV